VTDELPMHYPDESPPTANGAKGRPRCRRHDWVRRYRTEEILNLTSEDCDERGIFGWWAYSVCARCGKSDDPVKARRGRTARARGNAFEVEVAHKLGGRRVGQYGDKVDVRVDGWLAIQCKNGAAYPERLDGWLRSIPVEAGVLRAVVLGDAPGPGRKRRTLIVLDLDDFADWYGEP
jgi:hypothetical protein